MIYSTIFELAIATLLATAVQAFDASSKENVVLYWGQNSEGTQERLSYYCESDAADILVLSFLDSFPASSGGVLDLNFASLCTDTFSDGLLDCTTIASDIETCQSLGKIVLLSMGGASGSYGFSSDSEAKTFASTLWDTFGEGSADERPFGDSVVDGFDLDIENSDSTGYSALVTELKSIFSSEGSKSYYISAAPQCPYPDASIGDLLENSEIDFAFIQFYNNYCSVDGTFNWDTWTDYAKNTSPNKDIKLFLGLPAASAAAGSGYVDVDAVKTVVSGTIASDSDNFGGIMLWDASQLWANEDNGENFAEAMKSILTEEFGSATSTASSSSSTTLATTTSSSSSSSSSSTSTTEIAAVEPTSTSTTEAAVEPTSTSTTEAAVEPTTTSTTEAAVEPTSTSTTEAAVEPTSTSTTEAAVEPTTTSTTEAAVEPTSTSTTEDAATTTSTTEAAAEPTTTLTTEAKAAAEPTTEAAAEPTSTSTTKVTAEPTTTTKTEAAVEPTTTSTTAVEPTSTSTTAAVVVPTTTSTTAAPTTFTPTTLATVVGTSTTSSSTTTTATPAATATGFVDCSSYSGLEKAECLNENYGNGLFLGSASSCNDGEFACSLDGQLAQCSYGSWVIIACGSGTECYAYNSGDYVSTGCNYSSEKGNYVF